MASRQIEDLHPKFGYMAREIIDRCQMRGVELLITCTLRSRVEQDQLYALGRTAPGRIVTNARAGMSAHNFGLAMDVVPMVHGKPEWHTDAPEWMVYGIECERAGAEWAGRWEHFREYPHCQLPNWREIAKVI